MKVAPMLLLLGAFAGGNAQHNVLRGMSNSRPGNATQGVRAGSLTQGGRSGHAIQGVESAQPLAHDVLPGPSGAPFEGKAYWMQLGLNWNTDSAGKQHEGKPLSADTQKGDRRRLVSVSTTLASAEKGQDTSTTTSVESGAEASEGFQFDNEIAIIVIFSTVAILVLAIVVAVLLIRQTVLIRQADH